MLHVAILFLFNVISVSRINVYYVYTSSLWNQAEATNDTMQNINKVYCEKNVARLFLFY
jgi:Na+/H+ antiporter NhaA